MIVSSPIISYLELQEKVAVPCAKYSEIATISPLGGALRGEQTPA